MDQYTAILFSIVSSILLGVPLFIIEKLFSVSYKGCKVFAYIIFSGCLLTCIYASLTLAALMGVEAANLWAFNYFTSFSLDFFLVAPLTNYFKVSLYYFSITSTNLLAKLL
jgi:hypothetical protein